MLPTLKASRGTSSISLDILIGFLAVTLINCSAFGGAVIYPFRKKPAFKWILSTFIGLGTVESNKMVRSDRLSSRSSRWNAHRIRDIPSDSHGE